MALVVIVSFVILICRDVNLLQDILQVLEAVTIKADEGLFPLELAKANAAAVRVSFLALVQCHE